MKILTSGESHGKEITGIIEGLPSNIVIDLDKINHQLKRRQMGYGRGKRMQIETDKIEITSGIRFGKTTGAPICLKIKNKDWENWTDIMAVIKSAPKTYKKLTLPRPGHSDICGYLKYDLDDIRNVLERSSARETAMRTAVGGVCRLFLEYFNIDIVSHTISVGNISLKKEIKFESIKKIQDDKILRCVDKSLQNKMIELIDKAKENGDTIGGVFEVICKNVCLGLGSYDFYENRLDAKISAAIMSIPGVKGVELGAGFRGVEMPGSLFHDGFDLQADKIIRTKNNAGGIEGGITNGENIIIRGAMKPIPTLINALKSVDLKSRQIKKAIVERSDVSVVPAAGVVGESMLSITLAEEILNYFGTGSIQSILKRYNLHKKKINKFI